MSPACATKTSTKNCATRRPRARHIAIDWATFSRTCSTTRHITAARHTPFLRCWESGSRSPWTCWRCFVRMPSPTPDQLSNERQVPHFRRMTSAQSFCSSHHCSPVSSSARWRPTLPLKLYPAVGSALDLKAHVPMAHCGHRSASASRPRYCRLPISAIACVAAEHPAYRSIRGRPNIAVAAPATDASTARPGAYIRRGLSRHKDRNSI